MGTDSSDFSVLEISRPTKMDLALSDSMISATPLAKTTTRETENVPGVSSEIDLTSSWEIVYVEELLALAQPASSNTRVKIPNFFTALVCQIFKRQVAVSCRISHLLN